MSAPTDSTSPEMARQIREEILGLPPRPDAQFIERAVVSGDRAQITIILAEFGTDFEAVFRAWFTGRPSYSPDDWLTLLTLLTSVVPGLIPGAVKP